MKKILYIVPGTGLPDIELRRREDILNSFASSEFKIHTRKIANGPPAIQSFCDEFTCVPDVLRIASIAEKEEGYSALIIGCFGDPGLDALKEKLSIPVIGPGEASLHLASALGFSFTIVSVLPNAIATIKTMVAKYGFSDRCKSIRIINKPVLDVSRDMEESKFLMLDEASKGLEVDHVDSIVLGCMSEAFLGFAEYMQQKLGVPVVNPVGVSVKMAELMIVNGLSHSKKAYMYPAN
jgi:allantoin racemase